MYEDNRWSLDPQSRHGQKPQHCFTTKLVQRQDVSLNNANNQQILMETSFENNLSDQHAKAIWNGSVQFLKSSLKGDFDEEKGFNDGNIFEIQMEIKDSMNQKNTLEQDQNHIFDVIEKNSILAFNEKKKLKEVVRSSTHIRKLLQQLSSMYNQPIFEELTVLIYQSLLEYLKYKNLLKLSKQFTKLLAKSYTNLDIQTNSQFPISTSPTITNESSIPSNNKHYSPQSQSQISNNATQSSIQIAGSYFISTKIFFLNLKQIQANLNNNNIVRSQFQKFVQIIVKGVYLCCQGCFQHPDEIYYFSNSSIETQSINQDISFNDQYQMQAGRKRRNY